MYNSPIPAIVHRCYDSGIKGNTTLSAVRHRPIVIGMEVVDSEDITRWVLLVIDR